jgi:hypothetical protein
MRMTILVGFGWRREHARLAPTEKAQGRALPEVRQFTELPAAPKATENSQNRADGPTQHIDF